MTNIYKWGRNESVIWPPHGPVYSWAVVFACAFLLTLFMYLCFQFTLSPLQQYYLPYYLRSEMAGTMRPAAAVTLATMHASKGLEWDAVLLPGLTEGIMPIVHARTAEAVEEERRLLYVAVTRARVHLALSWAPARTPGAEGARQRSRFLPALQAPLAGARG